MGRKKIKYKKKYKIDVNSLASAGKFYLGVFYLSTLSIMFLFGVLYTLIIFIDELSKDADIVTFHRTIIVLFGAFILLNVYIIFAVWSRFSGYSMSCIYSKTYNFAFVGSLVFIIISIPIYDYSMRYYLRSIGYQYCEELSKYGRYYDHIAAYTKSPAICRKKYLEKQVNR